MSVSKEIKATIVAKFARSEGDTGSAEVQIAILTERIKNLTAHLQVNKKDVSTRRGLIGLVAKRNKMVRYLKGVDAERYGKVIAELGIRG
ncbi:MAG: 30S ribosomal protein S15 [Planctomycetes bacterium]|nr:30S ribosomal protein S15 [Planctomycetota bacterium]MBL7008075.1 30S ribosomal protein S15 [Planctomycetota bacterium]